jgi:hypothetical protein
MSIVEDDIHYDIIKGVNIPEIFLQYIESTPVGAMYL